MKSVYVELPDEVDSELKNMVAAGWFASQDEAIRMALLEFLKTAKLHLTEKFQMEDIQWALNMGDKKNA